MIYLELGLNSFVKIFSYRYSDEFFLWLNVILFISILGAPSISVKDDSHWLLHAHYFPPLIRSATVRMSIFVSQSVRIFLAKT